MTLFLLIFFILIGILLLFLELAVLPGITIAGVGGVLMLGASIYLSFSHYGVWAGIVTLIIIFTIVPLLLYRFFTGKASQKMMLNSEVTGTVTGIDSQLIHPGDEGITVGRLAPGGKVKVHNQIVEGKSISGFIDPDQTVKILEVTKNQVIVEPINH